MAGESREMGSYGNHYVNQIPNFESNPELYNLTTGMEMLAFPSKNRDVISSSAAPSVMWKGFSNKQGHASSSSASPAFYSADQFSNKPDFSGGFTATTDNLNWVVEDDYPTCERVVTTTQGLSLSLCSNELRQTSSQQEGYFGRSISFQNPQEEILHGNSTQFQLRNSIYFSPAQELLNEFCSLGNKIHDNTRKKLHKMNQWEDGKQPQTQSSSLTSLDLIELQRRKAKLISMIDEVDRRYRQYCDQMKSVVSSFEAVVGSGAASVYSALASKAMSRHFRTLRDSVVAQVKATKKAMGEKDTVAPGTTRGETPRLRVLDQTLRQQRAFQQMTMMENHPWRPQRGLPDRSVSILRAWLFEHFLHPYPSDVDKHILARQTGLSRSQVSNWFINARVRLWKPMVEEMYLEETKEQDNFASADRITGLDENSRPYETHSPSHSHNQNPLEDQKPTPNQLLRNDSDSLSSIINIPEPRNARVHNIQLQHRRQLGKDPETFGAVDVDFASYGVQQNFGKGVSLTLGLQQHGEGGSMNLSFSPPSQHSLFYPRDHIEDCEQAQYSFLDADGENLPYRNLTGAQLLHDFSG